MTTAAEMPEMEWLVRKSSINAWIFAFSAGVISTTMGAAGAATAGATVLAESATKARAAIAAVDRRQRARRGLLLTGVSPSLNVLQ